MIVLVLESASEGSHALVTALEALGHRAYVVAGADDARAAVAAVPPPDAVVATADADPEAAAVAVEADLPVVLADDRRGIPAALSEVGVRDSVSLAHGPEGLRVGLEAALRRHRRDVEAQRLAAAIESSAAAVVVADTRGRVLTVNGAFARVAGGAPRDPVGTLLGEVLAYDGGPDGDRDAFDRALRGEAEWTGDAMLVGGGVRVPCRASLSPLRAEGAAAGGVVAVLVDLADHAARDRDLREANAMLERQASLDPLTRAFNRAYFGRALEREVARARRYGRPAAVVMFDLDDFKRVNDRLGHPAGDEVLRAVAETMRLGLRDGDELARYGGDEFCALLPSADAATARQVAERLEARVGAVGIGPLGAMRVSLSWGVASTDALAPSDGADSLVRLADQDLMAHKRVRHGAGAAGEPGVSRS